MPPPRHLGKHSLLHSVHLEKSKPRARRWPGQWKPGLAASTWMGPPSRPTLTAVGAVGLLLGGSAVSLSLRPGPLGGSQLLIAHTWGLGPWPAFGPRAQAQARPGSLAFEAVDAGGGLRDPRPFTGFTKELGMHNGARRWQGESGRKKGCFPPCEAKGVESMMMKGGVRL